MTEQSNQTDELLATMLNDTLPHEVNQRLRSQLADFRLKLAEPRQLSTEWRIESGRRLWIGLTATAAAVLIVACAIAFLLRPQMSFAEVIAAVRQLPWIHVSIKDGTGASREVWYSPARDVSASRSSDWIEYHDHKLRIYYSYDIGEGILYRVPEHRSLRASHYASMTDSLRILLQSERLADDPLDRMEFLDRNGSKPELLEQKLTPVEEGAQSWLEYELTIRYAELPEPIRLLFRVDPESKLPRLCRVEGRIEGKDMVSEQRFDYAETGPADVYEIGVPRTAKLIDRIPSDDIVRIQETLRAGRQRMDDYRAIVVSRMDDPDDLWWINEQPMMFYRKGDKTRVDSARWTGDFPRIDKPSEGADMEMWWRKRAQDFVYCPFYITDGPIQYLITVQVAKSSDGADQLKVETVKRTETNQLPGETYPPYYSRSPEFVCRPPLGIPRQDAEPVIEKSPTEGPPGSILLRVARSGRMPGGQHPPKNYPRLPDLHRFWLDPARDFAVLRWDMIGADESGKEKTLGSTLIEELKRSPGGTWYAQRFRVKAVPPVEHDQIFDVYIDFDVDLPGSLFDAPTVGQVLR